MENRIVYKNPRLMDTAEYLFVLKGLTEQGKSVGLLISGNSMSPFLIHQRDQVFFEKPKRKLKRGDIVFYQRENGQYIMHRIYKKDNIGYYMVGDAQQELEGPITENQIFALITKVRRKGKIEESGTFWWDFFEKVWIRILPLRPWLRNGYTLYWKFCKKIKRENRNGE